MMPPNLLIAYAVFCGVPLGMAIVFAIRRRFVERRLRQHRQV